MKLKRTFSIFILLTIILSSLTVITFAQEPEVTVTKTTTSSDINKYGTGSPDTTIISISVEGYGGTIEDTIPLDVVFSIDSSGSMGWTDPSNLRITAAKNFVDMMDSDRDQAGIVSWHGSVEFTYGLTDDFTTLKSEIDNIGASGGTNIDVGLSAAILMLDANTRTDPSEEVIIFLSDGIGTYTPSGDPDSYTDEAADKGYIIYTILLETETYPAPAGAEDILEEIAIVTGGLYYSAPSAETLDDIFDEILQTIVEETSPYDVNVHEVTQSYIVAEGSWSITPDLIQEVGGETNVWWYDVAQHVGNYDNRLDADETFTVSFTAGSSQAGQNLPVDVEGSAVVEYTDPEGASQTANIPQAYINVNAPPDCTNAYADPGQLWPPNHKMVEVHIMGVTDAVGDEVTIIVTDIYQDEPTEGLGDGDMAPDAVNHGNYVELRAERSGLEDGRVYTITYTATDDKGASCTCEVTVEVPHDKKDTALDSGPPYYDSTLP